MMSIRKRWSESDGVDLRAAPAELHAENGAIHAGARPRTSTNLTIIDKPAQRKSFQNFRIYLLDLSVFDILFYPWQVQILYLD